MNLRRVRFIRSAASQEGFARDGLPQIIMAGRSNVGKSSVINALLGQAVARISSVPGKTSQINLFLVDERLYLVDLPGYGYAKVSHQEQERWGRLMAEYFDSKPPILRAFLIIDARHPDQKKDQEMASFFMDRQIPFSIVANKTDKLKKSELAALPEAVSQGLQLDREELHVVPLSAKNKTGVEALGRYIISLGGAN